MDENTVFKLKNRIFSCSVKFILLNGIICILSSKLAFQLHRHYRNTIEKQHNINAVFVLQRIVELSCTMQNIGSILCLTGFIDGGFRFPKYCTEFDTTVSKSLTQHFEQSHHFHLTTKTVNDLTLTVRTIDFLKPLPLFWLTCPNKGKKCIDI